MNNMFSAGLNLNKNQDALPQDNSLKQVIGKFTKRRQDYFVTRAAANEALLASPAQSTEMPPATAGRNLS